MPTATASPPRADLKKLLAPQRCRLCGCKLGSQGKDDLERLVCADCTGRPEAHRLGPLTRDPDGMIVARAFQVADLSLIKRAGAYMQPVQLLSVLNERLFADLGSAAPPHTMAQLQQALHEQIGNAAPSPCSDWAGLRKVLATARQGGLLDRITQQLIDDFAVVYALSPAQALRLKDVLLSEEEDDA